MDLFLGRLKKTDPGSLGGPISWVSLKVSQWNPYDQYLLTLGWTAAAMHPSCHSHSLGHHSHSLDYCSHTHNHNPGHCSPEQATIVVSVVAHGFRNGGFGWRAESVSIVWISPSAHVLYMHPPLWVGHITGLVDYMHPINLH